MKTQSKWPEKTALTQPLNHPTRLSGVSNQLLRLPATACSSLSFIDRITADAPVFNVFIKRFDVLVQRIKKLLRTRFQRP